MDKMSRLEGTADPAPRGARSGELARRDFTLGAITAGLLAAVGASTRRADAGPVDETKEYLQEVKDFACAVSDVVAGDPGPLTDEADKIWVRNQVVLGAGAGQRVLTQGPLFTPPATWLFWMPIDTSQLNLTQTADTACAKACEALEEYCASIGPGGTPEQEQAAAEALWQTQQLYCHLLFVAGISS